MADPATSDLLPLTAQIVAAHVTANRIASEDVPGLINEVYGALAATSQPVAAAEPVREPAVPIKRSVQPDYLVCLEDGAKVKTLKRYIMARFGLTPDAYRAKWGLPRDYPMSAPGYSAKRSALAKQFGLGTGLRTPEQSAPEPEPPELPAEVEEPTVPVPEPEHTATSVFAKFPAGEGPTPEGEQVAQAAAGDKPKRRRFGQQTMHPARRWKVKEGVA